MSIWDSLCEEKLMDWGIVGRHRKRAYAEGFRDGVLVGSLIVVGLGGVLALWIKNQKSGLKLLVLKCVVQALLLKAQCAEDRWHNELCDVVSNNSELR